MEKNNLSDFIGRGEKEVEKILQGLFPSGVVSTQVPIYRLIKEEDYDILDQEIKNHKFDLVVYMGMNILVIEVNYKHGEKAAKKWSEIFVPLLRKAERIPVTIEDYNCEYLFSDATRLKKKKPWGSYIDVLRELERNHVGPDGTLLKV